MPGNAYEVVLTPPGDAHGSLSWKDANGDKPETYSMEPGANPKRRIQVAFMRLFPIDGLL